MIDYQSLMTMLDGIEASRSIPEFRRELICNALARHLPSDARELDDKDEPAPMDTLGSLIDKLITVDLKMWHNQEQLYAIRRMTVEQFQERYGAALPELHDVVKRCCDLNVQRSRLVDAIDAKLLAVYNGSDTAVTAEAHKTY